MSTNTNWYTDASGVYVQLTGVSAETAVSYLHKNYVSNGREVVSLVKAYPHFVSQLSSYMPSPARNIVKFNYDGSVNYTDAVGKGYYSANKGSFGKVPPVYSGKIIKFYYSGGSKSGNRIVKVISEDSTGIYGTDLEKGEIRNYLRSKMGTVQLV